MKKLIFLLGGVIIHVLDADNPCKELCQFRVVMSSATLCKGFSQLKMVRGLAYDACKNILTITSTGTNSKAVKPANDEGVAGSNDFSNGSQYSSVLPEKKSSYN